MMNRGQSSGVRKPYEIDLSKARDGQEIRVMGRYIRVSDASSASAEIEIALTDNVPSQYEKLNNAGFIFESNGFSRFFIKNSAQAGERIRLIVTDGPEDYDVQNATQNIIQAVLQPVKTQGGSVGAYGPKTIGNTATGIFTADSDVTGWAIVNNGANTIFLGTDNLVTTANGFPLEAGEKFSWDGTHDLYGIVAAGTEELRYMKQGNS